MIGGRINIMKRGLMKKTVYDNMTVDQLKAELRTFEDATNDNSFTKVLRVQAEKEARIIKVKLLSAMAKAMNTLD
jgi:hypothetical protein